MKVVLCDERGRSIGVKDKLESHLEPPSLHLAITDFIIHVDRWTIKILLQERSDNKNCPGMLAPTCCTHPYPGESFSRAAHRRLKEEMGIEGVPLYELYTVTYKTQLPGEKLWEWEHDHIFFALVENNIPVKPNPDEVSGFVWMDFDLLMYDMVLRPRRYVPWLGIILRALPVIIGE